MAEMEDCANPLFAEWLKEEMDVASERSAKSFYTYRRAYQSMKACTVTLQHASEADQLDGIGPKLRKKLEDKHIKHCQDNSLPLPEKPGMKHRLGTQSEDSHTDAFERVREELPAKRPRNRKQYVPKHRTGAWALVMALSETEKDGNQGLTKDQLVARGQPYCDSSFTIPSDTTKTYTAWKSMEHLQQKELVYTRGHPLKRYCLTDEGWATSQQMRSVEGGATISRMVAPRIDTNGSGKAANMLRKASAKTAPSARVIDLDSASEGESIGTHTPKLIPIKDSSPSAKEAAAVDLRNLEPLILKPGTFDVKILVDLREIRAKSDRAYISNKLNEDYDITADIRALPLGDVLWIAKVKPAHAAALRLRNSGDDDEGSDEIVLEHIVERKRLDDLIMSIRDGRFHEQKFRLKKSGMRHVTYLVENYTLSAERAEHNAQSIESALAQLQVVDDVFLKQTAKIDESVKYLAQMTMSLKQMYEGKELHVLPSASLDVSVHHKQLETLQVNSPSTAYCVTFSAFSSLCDKSDSLTLRDQYLKMLMCIKGLTGDKAVEIQKIWPTPAALVEAYSSLGSDATKKNTMISERLGKEIMRKRVGEPLSRQIAEVWAC